MISKSLKIKLLYKIKVVRKAALSKASQGTSEALRQDMPLVTRSPFST